MTALAHSSTSGSATFPAARTIGGFAAQAVGHVKQSPARALAITVANKRAAMLHCLKRCEFLEALHSEYIDEYLTIAAEVERLRTPMMSSALREMRELMCRQHPDFAGAIAIPRPTFGRAAP